jgi:hypothetical protein
MSGDLFGPAVARRTDPETSHQAAEAITPQTGSIRLQVEAFAISKGERGFIDEELSKAFEASDVSSYRTRRAELTEVGTICDSGRTKANEGGRQCVIWVHKSFHNAPSPIPDRTPPPDERTKANALRIAKTLDGAATQMRAEARFRFAEELKECANLARAWSV